MVCTTVLTVYYFAAILRSSLFIPNVSTGNEKFIWKMKKKKMKKAVLRGGPTRNADAPENEENENEEGGSDGRGRIADVAEMKK